MSLKTVFVGTVFMYEEMTDELGWLRGKERGFAVEKE